MVTLVGNAVIVVMFLAVIGYAVRGGWYRLRRERPLREEMRARPATFRAAVNLQDLSGPASLSVHGDVFEVALRVPVVGFLNGADYSYRAPDSTVETVHGLLHDWIEIRGLPGTGAEPIRIGRWRMNRQLWDVLVDAGAHPVGPPPAR